MNIDLRLGDCLEVLKTLPNNSVDSVVVDPPYGLEFMGKEWDTFKTGRIAKYKEGGSLDLEQIKSRTGKGGAGPSYTKRPASKCKKCGKQRWSGSPCKCDEPDFEIDNSTQHTFQSFTESWATECYRVLKPGGHILAFGGSRMYHRLASGIEDAGFEVRDQIMWIYGSGFPKSHNIGKAIDKRGGESIGWFGEWLVKWRKENNIPQSKIAELFPSKTGGLTGCVSNWELGNNLPTNEQFNLICETFDLPFKSLEEAEREFIGTKTSGIGKAFTKDGWGSGHDEVEITKGSSDWEGWGTALKPAHEPICMARKPLSEKSIAENVLKWGTGGINIDGCRIGSEVRTTPIHSDDVKDDTTLFGLHKTIQHERVETTEGRFPANIMFDDDTDEDWKRYFYCPKTSKKERNAGMDVQVGIFYQRPRREDGTIIYKETHPEEWKEAMNKLPRKDKTSKAAAEEKLQGQKGNVHPTVKPIKLMEYLITLVTPKGGVVMDCFMGSGSTGIAAKNLGFSFIGIEREQEYFDIAKQRIGQSVQTKLDL